MKGFVYIMTNNNHSVLYIGVTSNLKERMRKHKLKIYPKSFTARYNICKLVYYECFDTIIEAIKREKAIKGGNRKRKIQLINTLNPGWIDLEASLK